MRIASLVIRTSKGLESGGIAEGEGVKTLKDKFRELKAAGVLPSSKGKGTPIREMRLLYDGIEGGILMRHVFHPKPE